jgi:hypothetical protein
MRPGLRRLVILLLAASLASCSPGAAPPSGGLTEAQAFAAARTAFPDATGVVSAKAGQMRDFDINQQVVPGDRWVWAVVVSGTFPFSCGPAPATGQTHAPCPPPGTTMTVILDYTTGRFLEAFGTSGSAASAVATGEASGSLRPGASGPQAPGSSAPGSASPTLACLGGLSPATCAEAERVALAAVAPSGRSPTHVWISSGGLCPWRECLFDPSANFPAQPAPSGGAWVGSVEIAFAGTDEHAGLNIAEVGHTLVATLIGYKVPALDWCSGTCPTAATTDGPFRFELVLPRLDWRTGDVISGSAILSLLDGPATTLYGASQALIVFSYDEVGGNRHSGYVSTADCGPYPIDVADPINRPLAKSGGAIAGSEPDAAWLRSFLTDPQIELPAGTWDITAIATFSDGTPCSGTSHTMQVTLRITVAPR